jgi:hypothetical protein
LVEPGSWLVVHSGPACELLELVGYVLDCAALEQGAVPIVLVRLPAPSELPPQVQHLDVYPATPLFPLAGRVITAAGWTPCANWRRGGTGTG